MAGLLSRSVLIALVTGMAATSLIVADGAVAASRLQAIGSWSMVPQAKDVDGDGVIDGDGGVPRRGAMSLEPSPRLVGAGNRIAQPHERLIGGTQSWYLSKRGFGVRLDACRSSGTQARWRIIRDGTTVATTPWRPVTRRSCATTVVLPEGDYSAILTVREGPRRAQTTVPITVDNLIVVSLGDSYASGEGNPRNVRAWIRGGGPFTPYWDDEACRRSARGAPALAALALEESSPLTSVTLIDVACSGATVDAGILGPQTSAGQSLSQVEQVTLLLGGRPADLVTLSVGGNDVGFGSILQACALSRDCPVATPPPGPLSGAPTVNAGVQRQTAGLSSDFGRIAACLGGPSCVLSDGRVAAGISLRPGGAVLPTLYPDITRAADGSACSYLSIPAQDFAWARSTILDPAPAPDYTYPLSSGATVNLTVAAGSLNARLLDTSTLPGWAPVVGTWSASGATPQGHGVCAGAQAWVFGFTGFSGLPSASFHPNPQGQAVLGAAIADAARAALAVVPR